MRYDFYAYMDRMKYIRRWQLMRSQRDENIMEHSQSVAMLAHALAVIRNKIYGGNVNVEKTVLYAMYHEISEVLTGDLPTPIKYYNKNIQAAYKDLERSAAEKMAEMLPPELKSELSPWILADEDSEEYKLVKAADRLSAYVKCLEELRAGNGEFVKAKKSIEDDLHSRSIPEVEYFFEHFIDSFSLTQKEIVMYLGQDKQMELTVSPNVSVPFTFVSDNPRIVAALSTGRLQAVKLGEATVTVSYFGHEETCLVRVVTKEEYVALGYEIPEGGNKDGEKSGKGCKSSLVNLYNGMILLCVAFGGLCLKKRNEQ